MLTTAEIAFFQEQGYLRIPKVLDASRIAHLLSLIDEQRRRALTTPTRGLHDLVDMNPDGTPMEVYRLSRVMERHPDFQAVAMDSQITAVVRDLLGADASVCVNRHNMMVAKAPHVGRPIAWHQDGATWGHDELVALIVFLSHAGPNNGCLEIIPGAHRRGVMKTIDDHGFACMDVNDFTVGALVRQALPVMVEAGDALFFHALLPHSSKANTSEVGRPTLTFAYVAEHTKALKFQTGMDPIQSLSLPN